MLDRERLSAITDNVVYDEPMSKHTTFRIGGTADAFKAVMTLREAGYSCDMNQIGRSMKAQMKQADRTGARFALIFGEEERSRGAVTVRNMADSSQEEIKRSEIVSYMKKAEV